MGRFAEINGTGGLTNHAEVNGQMHEMEKLIRKPEDGQVTRRSAINLCLEYRL
jgi:hypothetical protein